MSLSFHFSWSSWRVRCFILVLILWYMYHREHRILELLFFKRLYWTGLNLLVWQEPRTQQFMTSKQPCGSIAHASNIVHREAHRIILPSLGLREAAERGKRPPMVPQLPNHLWVLTVSPSALKVSWKDCTEPSRTVLLPPQPAPIQEPQLHQKRQSAREEPESRASPRTRA